MKINFYKAESLMTILIVISVIGILVAIVVPPLASSKARQQVTGTTDDIVALLVTARSQTLSSYNSHNYGVHFTSTTATLFTGPTYNANASDNEVKTLDSSVSISTISLSGGGSDLLFDRLTGSTSQYGTITIRATSNAAYTKTINIQATGLVSVN